MVQAIYCPLYEGAILYARGAAIINKYNKTHLYILLYKVVSVFCLSRTISLTAKPILFSFTVKLLIGTGKVLNYFWEGCLHPLPHKKLKLDEVDFSPSYLKCPRDFQGRSRQSHYRIVVLLTKLYTIMQYYLSYYNILI